MHLKLDRTEKDFCFKPFGSLDLWSKMCYNQITDIIGSGEPQHKFKEGSEMITFADIDNHTDIPQFVSYRTNAKLLTEVLFANNIKGVELMSSNSGVRAALDDGYIVVACEGLDDKPTFPQALARAWVSGSGITGLIQYKELEERNLSGENKTPAENYRLSNTFDGSEAAKLNVLHDIFTETDILERMEIEETRVYKATDEFVTKLGNFKNGGEKFVLSNGRLKGYSARSCGDTVIDYYDGRLSVADCGEAKWTDRMLHNTMEYLLDRSRTVGVSTIEKVSCPQIFTFEIPVQCTEVGENAFADCVKLRSVNVARKDSALGKGFIGSHVRLKGDKGSSAEKYAQENNVQFEPELLDTNDKKLVNITENISLTIPSESSFAKDTASRSYIYELFFENEYIDVQADVFVNDNASAEKLKAALLENGSVCKSEKPVCGVEVFVISYANNKKAYCIEIANGGERAFIHTQRNAADNDIFELFKALADGLDIEAASPEVTQSAAKPVEASAVSAAASPEAKTQTTAEKMPAATQAADAQAQPQTTQSTPTQAQPAQIASAQPAKKLVRGERMTLDGFTGGKLNVRLECEGGAEIDGYMFLLKADGKVRSDEDLVFFGQNEGSNGAVKLAGDNKGFDIVLDKVDSDIEKIAAAYAVYEDDKTTTFGNIKGAVIKVGFEGRELCEYELSGFGDERSAVTVELYKKGGWKLRTVGQGYKGALKSLCESYGVEVE